MPMPSINDLDLKNILSGAVQSVFETMLDMSLTPSAEIAVIPAGTSRVVGSVGFAGKAMGSVNIHVSEHFARVMTARMLGMDESEIADIEEVLDVIGEVCNMVGGDLKSTLCDAGFGCELSIPSTTTGKDFHIESVGWDRCERVAFTESTNGILIEVTVKSSNS